MQEYEEWIKNWLQKHNPKAMCQSATYQMHAQFPELRKVRGYVFCDQGSPEHWWCEDKDGRVLDPTASQFTGIYRYEEYQEGMEVRIGKCMNCGDDIYDNTMNSKKSTCVCSKECEDALTAELNHRR